MKKISISLILIVACFSACAQTPKRVVIVSGTVRPDSQTLRVAHQLEERYTHAGVQATLLDIAELDPAIFTPQSYVQKPADLKHFNGELLAADVVVVVVPEYNAGIPGLMKHIIDMLAWPDTFKGKKYAVVTVSAGEWGGARAYAQLEKNLNDLGADVISHKTMIGNVHTQLATKASIRALTTDKLDKHVEAVLAAI